MINILLVVNDLQCPYYSKCIYSFIGSSPWTRRK